MRGTTNVSLKLIRLCLLVSFFNYKLDQGDPSELIGNLSILMQAVLFKSYKICVVLYMENGKKSHPRVLSLQFTNFIEIE